MEEGRGPPRTRLQWEAKPVTTEEIRALAEELESQFDTGGERLAKFHVRRDALLKRYRKQIEDTWGPILRRDALVKELRQEGIRTVNELYERCQRQWFYLSRRMGALIEGAGFEILPAPTKSKQRALDKANSDYGGDVARLCDIVRVGARSTGDDLCVNQGRSVSRHFYTILTMFPRRALRGGRENSLCSGDDPAGRFTDRDFRVAGLALRKVKLNSRHNMVMYVSCLPKEETIRVHVNGRQGHIDGQREHGTYLIAYDDGGRDEAIPGERIKAFLDARRGKRVCFVRSTKRVPRRAYSRCESRVHRSPSLASSR